jgi:DMSO/TMAO reductase YedYZ molybdopterin-dependent catalytic subunit
MGDLRPRSYTRDTAITTRAAFSRRRFLSVIGAALTFERLLDAQALAVPVSGRLVRRMPLGRLNGRPAPPVHTLLGAGLDARLFTDLSDLGEDRLITPTQRFFIRTSHPPALPSAAAWRVALGGRVQSESTLALDTIVAQARPMGTHLMECSGNADPANFGLLSAASWDGVPMADLLDRIPVLPEGRRIRVTGLDDDARPSESSVSGASWIFTRDELQRAGAFLATQMNDAPLALDHGAPVRLVVPNYYGCSNLKWVSRIDMVGDDEPATPQMREFSSRTHQSGVPALARDYEPPFIDLAATAVRVEQWLVGGRVVYRVVGIRWGGAARQAPLMIRFKHTEPFVPVGDCPDSGSSTTWSLWSHTWHPVATGQYQIALSAADTSTRTRRLDLFYYTREVAIDRVEEAH